MINLDDSHKGDDTLGYRINCGTDEWIPGQLTEGDKSEFHVKNLKVKDRCELRVLHPDPPSNMKFVLDPGVLYNSDPFTVTATPVGQLEALVPMAPQYQLQSEGVRLAVPVEFKDKLPSEAQLLRASASCTPDIEGASQELSDIKGNSGVFVFTGGIVANREYVCKSLFVNRESKTVFIGDFNETVNLKPGDNKTAKNVLLKPIDVSKPEGINVLTKAAGRCKPDEVFDIATRACVKK